MTASAATEEQWSGLRHARYWVTAGGWNFEPSSVKGEEGLSRPSRFEVVGYLDTVEGDPPAPQKLVGDHVTVTVHRGGAPLRRIALIVTEARVSATKAGRPVLVLVAESRIARLRYQRDARVFVDRSVPAIVREILADGHVPYSEELVGEYPERAYCVQYQETNANFVARLLEDEGIYYVCRDDGEVVLSDDSPSCEEIEGGAELQLGDAAALRRDAEVLLAQGQRPKLTASEVAMRDYNPEHPRLSLEVADATGSPVRAPHYDFPGRYAFEEEGRRKAGLIKESIRCEASLLTGSSDCARLVPGRRFRVSGAREGIAREQLVVALHHDFEHERGEFSLTLESIDVETPYRPLRRTAAPTIRGFLTATVCGPAGEDIHTDDYGRVKIRFPWDRRSAHDGSVSSWIPVLQDDTGHSCAIPRIGWEVLVGFVEGDPDRPVVLGRVYNGADPMPDELPAKKTRTALQSLTSPGRSGANTVRIDDAAGAEQVYVQAERDQDVRIAHDRDEQILASEKNAVGGDESVSVDNDVTVNVGSDYELSVQGDQTRTIGASRRRDVGANDGIDVAGNRSWSIGASHIRRIEGYDSVRVGDLRETVVALDLEACLKESSTSAEYGELLTVGGGHIELTTETKSEAAKLMRAETIGGALFTKASELAIESKKATRNVQTGGSFFAKGADSVLLKAQDWSASASGGGTVEADGTLTLKVGSTVVTLSSSTIAIEAAQSITISADNAASLDTATAYLNSEE